MHSKQGITLILLFGLAFCLSVPSGQPVVQAQTAENVTFLGQIGGRSQAVAAQGQYVYLGEGSTLTILDVSDPSAPLVMSRTPLASYSVLNDITASDNTVYATSGGRLWVFDVSDPGNPYLLSNYEPPAEVNQFTLAGAYAYLAAGQDGLRVINISDPASPIEVGFLDTSGSANDVAIAGNYAYLSDYDHGLRVINISDPALPVEVGHFDPPENFFNVAVSGGYAYLGEDTSHLRVVDVSDPSNPVLAGVLETPGWVYDLALSGAFAYAVDYYQGLHLVDLSNPAAPTIIGAYHSPAYAERVAISGAFAYLTRTDGGMWVVDLSDPAQPDGVGGYDTPGNVVGVAQSWPYVYAVDENGLWVIDANNPVSPQLFGFANTTNWANDVAVGGGYAYLADHYYGLRIIDVSDPVHPVEVGSRNSSVTHGVALSSDVVFLATRLGLIVVDVQDPTQPVEVGFCETNGEAMGVAISGSYAYVPIWEGGLRIIDIADPAQPVEVGSVNALTYPVTGAAVSGANVFVTAGNGLLVFDASDPANPVQVGLDYRGGSHITLSGERAYLTGSSDLLIKDISNPAYPFETGLYPTPGGGRGAAVHEADIYVANGGLGLLTLRYGASPIMVAPDRLPADGSSAATVTVTLRDENDQPLAGKTVWLESSRTPLDFIQQPASPTNSEGVTRGWISSNRAGTSILRAINLTDGIQLPQTVEVQFTQESLALRASIQELNASSLSHLDTIEGYATHGAELGDSLRLHIRLDGAKLAMDGIFYIFSGVSTIQEMSGPAAEVMYPGIKTLTESHKVSDVYKDGKELFDKAIIEAVQTSSLKPLSTEILMGGAKYFGAKAFDKYVIDKTFENQYLEAYRIVAEQDHGLSDLAAFHRVDSINLRTTLDDRTVSALSQIPALTPEEEAVYVADLKGRRLAMTIWRLSLFQKLNLLESIHDASGAEDPLWFMASKFLLKDIIGSYLGPGKLLISTTDLALKMAIESQKADVEQRAYQAAPLLLFGAAETDAKIYLNQVSGLEQVIQRKPASIPSVSVESRQNYSEGKTQLLNYWNEKAAYTTLVLRNTGDETTTYEIHANYLYEAKVLGQKWTYMPVTASSSILLTPGQSGEVSVYYKREAEGGSPISDGGILLMILGTNQAGSFYIQTETFPWDNLVYLEQPTSASSQIKTIDPRLDQPDADLTVIENPLDAYVMGDPVNDFYQVDLFAANPFTETIEVTVEQTIPAGFELVSTDGQAMGSMITWQTDIPARGFVRLRFSVRNPVALPGSLLQLPAAMMHFIEPKYQELFQAESNLLQFKANWPVVIEPAILPGIAGYPNPATVKVRNISLEDVRGSLILRLTDVDGLEVYRQELVYWIAPGDDNDIPYILRELPAGAYGLEICPNIGNSIDCLHKGAYLVNEPWKTFLPMVNKR